LQQREGATTIDQLIEAVIKVFGDFLFESLDNVFLSLQAVLECIMTHQGGNSFKLPHLGKALLRREEKVPEAMVCKLDSIEDAFESLLSFQIG
jgi:hypothetical protein